MNTLKFMVCGTIAVLGLTSSPSIAEGLDHKSSYGSYHSAYEGMLSQDQRISLHNYLQYEQREPCQNYKILPMDFYRDGCALLYRYPRIEQEPPNLAETSIKRIVLSSYTIEFAFDSAVVEAGAEPVLAQIAREIKKYNPRDVTVSGYTDSHGTESYNVVLSQRRADSVSKVLNDRGVPNRSLGSQAYGETNQAVHTPDGVALRANRRVIVEFLK